jgi:predicted permease
MNDRLRGALERLRSLFGKAGVEAEMEQELSFHLAMETEKNLRKGMDPIEARREAMVAFGGVERFKERTRDERGVRPLEDLVTDLRYAFRQLWKYPGFTLIALASLAVGIGANTGIFTFANAILLQESPIREPHRLVNVYRDRPNGQFDPLNYPDFLEISRGTEGVFSEMAGFQFTFAQADRGNGTETLIGEAVTGNYFPLLGISAHLGRMILPEDHVDPGGHPVIVLGHGYWQSRFAGSPSVLGQSLRLNGQAYTIVGVAPRDFPGSWVGFRADFFAPIMMIQNLLPMGGNPLESRGYNSFNATGRMAPGITVAAVGPALSNLTAELKLAFPDAWSAQDSLVYASRADLLVNPGADGMVVSANILAMGVVGLVLLIACANLTSFLLARSTSRRKEIAVRLAMGATRGRLARQLLTETVLLGVLGGAAGLLVAHWVVDLAMGLSDSFPIPITLDLSFDGPVLAFTLGVSLATGLLVGLAPALQGTRPELAPTLKDEGTGSSRLGALRLRTVLVGGQMAVSVVLLVTAGLFLRSLEATRTLDPGFGQEPTAMLSFVAPADRYTVEEGRNFVGFLMEQARTLPGVTQVGLVGNPHLTLVNSMFLDVSVEGVPPPPGRDFHLVDFTSVDEGFFDASGIDLVEGRNFDTGDRDDGEPVAIINQVMADRFWPGESAVGKVIQVSGFDSRTVVGVASSTKVRTLSEAPRPFMYLPYEQWYSAWVTILAKTEADAGATAQRLFRMVREADPDAIITDTKTMEEHIGVQFIPRRLSVALSGVFSAVALFLALIGLFGVVSFSIARRQREMGIRMALGAGGSGVVWLMVREGMKVVVIGGALGILASAGLAQLLQTFLYGVPPLDPVTFLTVPGLLAGVGVAAAYFPARKASRVNPVEVLKRD